MALEVLEGCFAIFGKIKAEATHKSGGHATGEERQDSIIVTEARGRNTEVACRYSHWEIL